MSQPASERQISSLRSELNNFLSSKVSNSFNSFLPKVAADPDDFAERSAQINEDIRLSRELCREFLASDSFSDQYSVVNLINKFREINRDDFVFAYVHNLEQDAQTKESAQKRLQSEYEKVTSRPALDRPHQFDRIFLLNSIESKIADLVNHLQRSLARNYLSTSRQLMKEMLEAKEAVVLDHSNVVKAKEQAEQIVGQINMLPTKNEVAKYSEMFKKSSDDFRHASKLWLAGVFLSLVAIVVASFLLFQNIKETIGANDSDTRVLLLNLSRLLIISGFFYCLVICNKNYKSSKHNQILNKHRENALASFQAFVDFAKADDAIKNAVLLETTKTIYGVQQTGYVKSDDDDSPNKLIDLIIAMQKK